MSFSHPPTAHMFSSVYEVEYHSIPGTPNLKRKRPNPLLKFSITWRLVLGFVLPAFIAALGAGVTGFQSIQLLSQESGFYQSFFQTYATLTTGNSYLQLMDSKVHSTLSDASIPHVAPEVLQQDQVVLDNLSAQYNTILVNYLHNELIDQHPDQQAFFESINDTGLATQQRSLATSALRTWQLYSSAQDQVLSALLSGDLVIAQNTEHLQGEPTETDALSALRTLIQFDGQLVTFVGDAAHTEQVNLLIFTIISALTAFLAIGFIGWLTSHTLIPRLRRLRGIALSVGRGEVKARVEVEGRDEIADVSSSVNTMLDAIVGLLEETRLQRDALIQATERLFVDLRMTNGGEMQLGAAVDNDPIGMLDHAFNFTIGRFRRFMTRTQTIAGQLDVLSRQGMEHIDAFAHATRGVLGKANSSFLSKDEQTEAPGDALAQIQQAREHVRRLSKSVEVSSIQTQVERCYKQCQSLSSLAHVRGSAVNTRQPQQLYALELMLLQLSEGVKSLNEKSLREAAIVETILKQLQDSDRSGIASHQVQEITPLIENFSHNMVSIVSRLKDVSHEIRANLTPFQLGAYGREGQSPFST